MNMALLSQKEAAKRFAEYWEGKGYEKGQSQSFWLSLLRDVFGIAEPEKFITFEDQVHLDNTSFIDGYIDSTHVMIEQKSLHKDLNRPIKQSNGEYLTPYEQAKRYSLELPYSKRPRWIVTSNFKSFLVYDMERPGTEPQRILLSELPEDYWRLEFLVDDEKRRIQKEQDISIDAGKIIKVLYDALTQCYGDMSDPVNQKSLNKLIVRLVFCLYAEDSEMFSHGQFQDYLSHFEPNDLSDALFNLFHVLDTPEEQRRRGLKAILAAFPYTNGGLFHDKEDADDNIIPELSDEVKRILVEVAAPFNWKAISPTIFGGIFESTLNPDTRREGGMHYTSIENIHKVIDPLFLDDLKSELDKALDLKVNSKRKEALKTFQEKIAGLKFLDPACGSGNFLTETFLSLRRLENRVIKALYGEGLLGLEDNLIKVSIYQFYGIEINDFAVAVATTALWISEAQMLRETESIILRSLPVLPLKTYTNIHEGNALRMDWNAVVPASELNYIMGNPPFVGARLMSSAQKEDMILVFGFKWKNLGNMDYVTGWYKKSIELMQSNNQIVAALVSTNSITQGEQVASLWKPLTQSGTRIVFAHRTFRWDSEATNKAQVHCVVVGFTNKAQTKPCKIFDNGVLSFAEHINAYLLPSDDIYIENRSAAICDVPSINYGSFALDDGNYTIKEAEYKELIAQEPNINQYLRPFMGAQEMLHSIPRWCVWLKGMSPTQIAKSRIILTKVQKVQEWRSKSNRQNTKALADTPTVFAEIRQPNTQYLAIPTVCSEKRRYIPIMCLAPEVIASNQIYIVPNVELYHLGILTSSVHMAWMRVVCGRLELRYRYSSAVVYNNFPWPELSAEDKARISDTAQAILDARAVYPESSLAVLYDEALMPPELRKAHKANDAAVLEAYGFPKDASESQIVAELFKLYQELTS